MKKFAVLGLAVGAVVAVILLLRKSRSSITSEEREARRAEKRRQMFEKMTAGMESMPEDFPPRVMFDNVAATRENSERILELLEKEPSKSEKPVVAAAT